MRLYREAGASWRPLGDAEQSPRRRGACRGLEKGVPGWEQRVKPRGCGGLAGLRAHQ